MGEDGVLFSEKSLYLEPLKVRHTLQAIVKTSFRVILNEVKDLKPLKMRDSLYENVAPAPFPAKKPPGAAVLPYSS
jgi:hypothetical protein